MTYTHTVPEYSQLRTGFSFIQSTKTIISLLKMKDTMQQNNYLIAKH